MGFFSRLFALPANKRAFVQSVLAALRERFPAWRFEPCAGELAILIIDKDDARAKLDLTTAWEQEERARLALARGEPVPLGGVAYVRKLLEAGTGRHEPDRDSLLRSVLPMVVPAAGVQDTPSTAIRRPLRADALDSAFAVTGEPLHWVDRTVLRSANVTPFEVASAAASNLRRREVREEDLELFYGSNGRCLAVFFSRKEDAASSWVFHPRLARVFRSFFPAGFHLAVPERELLVAAPADGTALLAVARLVRERFERAISPISPLLYPASAFQPRE